jgi:hypothetical protein
MAVKENLKTVVLVITVIVSAWSAPASAARTQSSGTEVV